MKRLTAKDRAKLRSLANPLEITLHVGKNGVSGALIRELSDTLLAHELVKCRVQDGALLTAREACDAACEATGAQPVQVIGTRFVIYKPHPNPEKRRVKF